MTDEEKQIEMLKQEALLLALAVVKNKKLVHDPEVAKTDLLYNLKEDLRLAGTKLYPQPPADFWEADEDTQAQMNADVDEAWKSLSEVEQLVITTKGELLTYWAPKLVATFEGHPDLDVWSTDEMFDRIHYAFWDKLEEIQGGIDNANIHNND